MTIGATLLIRADASSAIGSGHVMRCLALAEAWQDSGGQVLFASCAPLLLTERLLRKSFQVLEIDSLPGSECDAQQTADLAREHGAEKIVVDGYHFAADFQRTLKCRGMKMFFLDDYGHASPYSADWVLNQSSSAQRNAYEKREPYTQLLLGPKYCLLRREFTAWQKWKREIAAVGHRVLVTMGGSDPVNFTQVAMQAVGLLEDDNLEVDVVIGAANRNSYPAEKSASQNKIHVHRDVTGMAKLMAGADVAISAAGTTAWELCFMGLPAILVTVASNQLPVALELSERRCAIHLGDASDVTPQKLASQLELLLKSKELRQAISSKSRELVDGDGAKRVVSALHGAKLQLRPVDERDIGLLWEWANDPQVRAASFSSEPISWENHEAWFANRMSDHHRQILIAEDETGGTVGQFRLDWRSPEDAEIDVSISREYRGRGYGPVLIDLGVNHAQSERRPARLHAFVKPENRASRRAFELARFENLGEEHVRGHSAVHYIRTHNPDR